MAARVWCWTPNPVLEIKFTEGRRIVSAGGKGHNVARQLRLWGVPAVSLVPKPGSAWIQAAGNDRSPIRKIPIRSVARTGWAGVSKPGERMDFFTEDPEAKTSDWRRCTLFFRRNLRKGDWLVVAGSVPGGAPHGWWRTLFARLKEKGVRILVDGRGRMLREGLQAGVEWAKANLAEVEETLGCRAAPKCLAKMRSLSNGRSNLLITRGSLGLILRAASKTMVVPAPKIRLRDATGSGDVVTAAVVYGIRKGWEIGKIAGFAVWAGSENAARRNEVVARLKGRGVFA